MASPTYVDQQQILHCGNDIIMTNGSDLDMNNGAIKNADIQAKAGSIGTTELADDAVTSDKLADAVNTSIAAKAAKVTSPTENNLAKLTAAGDLADSGVAAADVATLTGLASETEGSDGASGVGYYDTALATGMTVAEALTVIVGAVFDAPQDVQVVVASGASTGASAANPDLIGAQIKGWHPVSGADQAVASIVVGVDGAITVTLAANSTAEAVYEVHLIKAGS